MDDTTKKILIGGISFVAGAAAGGAGMFFYAKRYFKAKSDAEIKDMADFYSNKYADDIIKEKEDRKNDREAKKESNEEEQTRKNYIEKTSLYSGEKEEKSPVAYGDCFRDPNTGDSSSSDIPKKKKGGKKKKIDIEVVDDSVWDENPGGLDSKFLIFYDADRVLVDEETEKCLEEDIWSGVIKVIEDNDGKIVNDTLILQDNKNNCLYHVTVEQAAYSEVGLDD